jgi:hypothetical protein
MTFQIIVDLLNVIKSILLSVEFAWHLSQDNAQIGLPFAWAIPDKILVNRRKFTTSTKQLCVW